MCSIKLMVIWFSLESACTYVVQPPWHRLQPCMIGYPAGCRSLLHCVSHNIVHKSVAISFSERQHAPMWGHSMPQCLSLQGCSLPHTFE